MPADDRLRHARDLMAVIARAATQPVDPDRLDQVDLALMDEAAPVVARACEAWFDLEVRGTEHLPEGPALVVGNHDSGITFVEALGWGARMYLDGHMDPPWHGLAHDAVVAMPLLGPFLVRTGAVRASPANADAALRAGRKVMVFPGGNPEAFRPWKDRNRVQLQGRTGFVRVALRNGVPIVPVVFHGGQDGFVVLSDNRWLARVTGARRYLRSDVWPLWLGLPWGVALGPWFHLPLPVKVVAEVLPPIDTAPYGPADADDPEALRVVHDRVVAAMQAALDGLVAEVPNPLEGAGGRLARSARALVGRRSRRSGPRQG